MKISKKLLSLLLCTVLVLTLVPTAAFADSTGVDDPNFSFTVNDVTGENEVVYVTPGDTVTVKVTMEEMNVSAWTGGVTCSDVEVLQYESITAGNGLETIKMGYTNKDGLPDKATLGHSEVEEANDTGNVGLYFFEEGRDLTYTPLPENDEYSSEVLITLTAAELGDAVIFGYETSDGEDGVEITRFAPVTVKVRNKAEISFDFDTPVALEPGDTFDGAAIVSSDAAPTYASNSAAVTVDPATGMLTAATPGSAVITVTVPETLEYKGASASYTVNVTDPAPAVTGSVSGTITTFKDTDIATAIALIPDGGVEAAYTANVTEYTLVSGNKYTAAYAFSEVEDGEYTLVISKENHVTREYDVTVEGSEVDVDAVLHLVGDVTGDGRINAIDLSRIKAHMTKSSVITDEYILKCANVAGNAAVNAMDLSRLKAHMTKSSLLW